MSSPIDRADRAISKARAAASAANYGPDEDPRIVQLAEAVSELAVAVQDIIKALDQLGRG